MHAFLNRYTAFLKCQNNCVETDKSIAQCMCTSKPSIESSFIAYLGRVTAKKFTIRFSVGLLQIFAIFETNFEGFGSMNDTNIFGR